MDRFRRIIEGGYQGFKTGDARQIITSAEVTQLHQVKNEDILLMCNN